IPLTIFLHNSPLHILITIIPTLLTLPLPPPVTQLLTPYKLPILTIPFLILTSFTILLSPHLKFLHTSLNLIPQNIQTLNFTNNHPIHFIQSLFQSFNQVFI
ncbi:urea transporter, partial [Staphylococcus aureus]|uniref:urea transporter n=1 Tax=Staphylococcus aureus TaxID=1280 RepID=UPI001642EC8B